MVDQKRRCKGGRSLTLLNLYHFLGRSDLPSSLLQTLSTSVSFKWTTNGNWGFLHLISAIDCFSPLRGSWNHDLRDANICGWPDRTDTSYPDAYNDVQCTPFSLKEGSPSLLKHSDHALQDKRPLACASHSRRDGEDLISAMRCWSHHCLIVAVSPRFDY